MFGLLLVIIYVSFVSLGLPDAVLGAAWPVIYPEYRVPVSWMGAISLIMSAGTVVSSLFLDRLVRKLGTGLLTACSVAMTAIAMLGFATASNYWTLIFWAIPYGLGAGSVDAALNNYVAVHYASRHMSWLHCMWGLGAMSGPYIMGYVLGGGSSWNMGYFYIAVLQFVLTAVLFFSIPKWKRTAGETVENTGASLSIRQIFAVPGAKAVMLTFLCYCALEQTIGQWVSSYLVLHTHMSEDLAAALAGLFFAGITFGRLLSGFLTIRFSDKEMMRIGFAFVGVGILLMLLPLGQIGAAVGLLIIGFGGAPIYPCLMHSVPEYFGEDKSQAIIGVLMAGAYVGMCIMPPVYGVIADAVGAWTLPVVSLLMALLMTGSFESLHIKKQKA